MLAAVVVVDLTMRLLRWMRIVSFRAGSVVDRLEFVVAVVVAAVGLGIVVCLSQLVIQRILGQGFIFEYLTLVLNKNMISSKVVLILLVICNTFNNLNNIYSYFTLIVIY